MMSLLAQGRVITPRQIYQKFNDVDPHVLQVDIKALCIAGAMKEIGPGFYMSAVATENDPVSHPSRPEAPGLEGLAGPEAEFVHFLMEPRLPAEARRFLEEKGISESVSIPSLLVAGHIHHGASRFAIEYLCADRARLDTALGRVDRLPSFEACRLLASLPDYGACRLLFAGTAVGIEPDQLAEICDELIEPGFIGLFALRGVPLVHLTEVGRAHVLRSAVEDAGMIRLEPDDPAQAYAGPSGNVLEILSSCETATADTLGDGLRAAGQQITPITIFSLISALEEDGLIEPVKGRTLHTRSYRLTELGRREWNILSPYRIPAAAPAFGDGKQGGGTAHSSPVAGIR